MRIDKEKFNQLKQLDRIEYRHKLNEIKEYFDGFGFFSFVNWSMIILGFVLLLAISSYSISEELFLSLLSIIFPLGKILIFLALFLLICEIIESFVKWKKIKELEEEYFSVEIKK